MEKIMHNALVAPNPAQRSPSLAGLPGDLLTLIIQTLPDHAVATLAAVNRSMHAITVPILPHLLYARMEKLNGILTGVVHSTQRMYMLDPTSNKRYRFPDEWGPSLQPPPPLIKNLFSVADRAKQISAIMEMIHVVMEDHQSAAKVLEPYLRQDSEIEWGDLIYALDEARSLHQRCAQISLQPLSKWDVEAGVGLIPPWEVHRMRYGFLIAPNPDGTPCEPQMYYSCTIL